MVLRLEEPGVGCRSEWGLYPGTGTLSVLQYQIDIKEHNITITVIKAIQCNAFLLIKIFVFVFRLICIMSHGMVSRDAAKCEIEGGQKVSQMLTVTI